MLDLSKLTSKSVGFLERMAAPANVKVARQTTAQDKPCCSDAPPEGPAYSPGVLWEGVFRGWSGYAKANREVMFRVANSMYVQIVHALNCEWEDAPAAARVAAHEKIRVTLNSPYLRFFGPTEDSPKGKRRRICWTMMETERVHPDMVRLINQGYDELWTPTRWNAGTFRDSGVSIPIKVMPLGVNPEIYRPVRVKQRFPSCQLISHGIAVKGYPEGFVFLSVSLPSFRKGFDLLTEAFEAAFRGSKDVHLVIATTHSTSNTPILAKVSEYKSNIWALEGTFDEHRMASMYASADAYVSVSRGEGFNLPGCEAAACGLPVIVPANSSHPEVFGDDAFVVPTEGTEAIKGAESVSPWYKGMPFSKLGKKSLSGLVDLLRAVRAGGPEIRRKADALRRRVIRRWSWDSSARSVTQRLMELQIP